jgi:hypothetical protein
MAAAARSGYTSEDCSDAHEPSPTSKGDPAASELRLLQKGHWASAQSLREPSERPQNEYDASAPNILGSPTDTPFTPSEAVSAKPPV